MKHYYFDKNDYYIEKISIAVSTATSLAAVLITGLKIEDIIKPARQTKSETGLDNREAQKEKYDNGENNTN